jgi:hypothetical protein
MYYQLKKMKKLGLDTWFEFLVEKFGLEAKKNLVLKLV